MKIGYLASKTGTSVETIRFYEREGLLPAPDRTAGNYRIYDVHHVERLSFIRHCRSLYMAMDEIKLLLRLKDAPAQSCGEVNRVLDEHIAHVDQRISELKSLQTQLTALRAQCADMSDAAHCGILKGLSEGGSPPFGQRSTSTSTPYMDGLADPHTDGFAGDIQGQRDCGGGKAGIDSLSDQSHDLFWSPCHPVLLRTLFGCHEGAEHMQRHRIGPRIQQQSAGECFRAFGVMVKVALGISACTSHRAVGQRKCSSSMKKACEWRPSEADAFCFTC